MIIRKWLVLLSILNSVVTGISSTTPKQTPSLPPAYRAPAQKGRYVFP